MARLAKAELGATARCAWTLPCPIHHRAKIFKHFQIPGKPNTFCCQVISAHQGICAGPKHFILALAKTNGPPAANPQRRLWQDVAEYCYCAQSLVCRHWLPVSKR